MLKKNFKRLKLLSCSNIFCRNFMFLIAPFVHTYFYDSKSVFTKIYFHSHYFFSEIFKFYSKINITWNYFSNLVIFRTILLINHHYSVQRSVMMCSITKNNPSVSSYTSPSSCTPLFILVNLFKTNNV